MSQIYVYDLTVKYSDISEKDKLNDWFKKYCKHWVFQLELGDSGYKHWQCRCSLIKKKRPGTMIKLVHETWVNAHVTPTSTNVANNDNQFSYVMKEDTRVEGPFSDKDEPIVIPKQYLGKEWYPWQQAVIDSIDEFEERKINIIIDPEGCKGKSTLTGYLACRNKVRSVPPLPTAKDIMRMVCDVATAKAYIFDLPRALEKKKLSEMYTAIEQIKNGHAFDDRYHYKEKWFDAPIIWVFTNIEPNLNWLTPNRWNLYNIEDNCLIKCN